MNLLKNPEFLLDVAKSSSVDSALSVISQVALWLFIGSGMLRCVMCDFVGIHRQLFHWTSAHFKSELIS